MTGPKTDGPWITRFAPSPTGELHLGNARTAVLNYLLARQSGGRFLLRLEDTDQERSTFAAEASILWSLAWLGLTPDEPVRRQSQRLTLYRQAVDRLLAADLAYPCFCSEAELQQAREQAAAQGLPPRYSGRCARLSAAERETRLARGEGHAVRFRNTAKDDITFPDRIKGQVSVPADAFGDFVLLRSNAWPSYNLAVVVDDAEMGVNLVVRGEDHLTNTARQILLHQALGSTPPTFAHHGLLLDSEGHKLSKRAGAASVTDCMRAGLDPLAVVHYLASLSGALPTKQIFTSLSEMVDAFNPFALGRGNAVMNMDELIALSARSFRAADPGAQVQALDRTLPTGNPWHALDEDTRRDMVLALRDNASGLDELRTLLSCLTDESVRFEAHALAQLVGNGPVLQALDEALSSFDPRQRLDSAQASMLLKTAGTAAGVKGRALYHPVRLALTGSEAGPELSVLLTLLNADRLRQRIRTALGFTSSRNT